MYAFNKNNYGKELNGKQINDMNIGKTFYMFNFVHNVGAKIGEIFTENSNNSKNYMTFTTDDYIFKHNRLCSSIYKINIPEDSTCYVEKDFIRTNKIIIIEKVDIKDIGNWNNKRFCLKAIIMR